MDLNYKKVEAFMKVKIPQEIEDEILAVYANCSMEHDMTIKELDFYFSELQLSKELRKMVSPSELSIPDTDIIDFERLLQCTYHLLIFMDNEEIIDEMWRLLIHASGRDVSFPQVLLKNHVLSLKDVQKMSNSVGAESSDGIIEMVSCATSGKRVYITYLDFAYILGKLGYLRF